MSKKINLFEDKTYDGFEWLEKAVEAYIFPEGDTLASFPDRIEITYDLIADCTIATNSNMNSELSELISFLVARKIVEVPEEHLKFICEWLEIKISPNTTIDLEEKSINGEISLVKKKSQLEDEDVRDCMRNRVGAVFSYRRDGDVGRMNEIMDLLGCKDSRQSRSTRHKVHAIRDFLNNTIAEDKWRVKNVKLMENCALWIIDYIDNGNLASLSNFTRLKCMVHKGLPIYSMEETK